MKTGILSLIIAIAVAVLSLFQFERYQKLNDEVNLKLAQYDKKINSNLETLSQARLKLDEQLNVIQARTNQLPQTPAALSTTQSSAQSLSSAQTSPSAQESITNAQALDTFRISEAYYLTEMAQERLQTTYDIPGALRLLNKANAILQKVNNPAYTNIRDLMSKQINALASISLPNIDEIWGTLNTLIEKIDTLSTKGLRLNDASLATRKNLTQAKNDTSWKEALNKAWEDLKDLIKIQRHSKPIDPILDQEEQLLATQHLHLILEQTRWAILHNNQVVYEQSIQEAIQWINTYFETSNPNVKNFEAALNTLAKLNVKPALPDLHQVLQRFDEQGNQ